MFPKQDDQLRHDVLDKQVRDVDDHVAEKNVEGADVYHKDHGDNVCVKGNLTCLPRRVKSNLRTLSFMIPTVC